MGAKKLISFATLESGHPFFLDTDTHPDWREVFQNSNPINLEIGFGNGNFLVEMAIREPGHNFVGLDFYHKGIRKAVTRIDKLLLKNIRIAYGDARQKLPSLFREGELNAVYINFPDPWPKKRHAKRRLLKPGFANLLANRLRPGGEVHVATDSAPYAGEILACLEAEPALQNQAGPGTFLHRRDDTPRTKYEKYFMQAGDKIYYLDFIKK